MARMRIMVIEDNSGDVFLLRRVLEIQREDFELSVLRDGEEALKFIRQEKERPHEVKPCVILLDLHLPKHDGLEILNALRNCPALGHVHVVVVSSLANPQEEACLRRMGAHNRLKPGNLTEYTQLALDLIAICKGLPMAA